MPETFAFADCKLGAEGGSRAKSILERNTTLTDLYVGKRDGIQDGSPNGERGFYVKKEGWDGSPSLSRDVSALILRCRHGCSL